MLMNLTASLLIASFCATGGLAAERGTHLLLPGEFHGSEVAARSGESWLALAETADGHFVVVPVTLRVEEVEDPVLDSDGQRTGKRVSAVGIDDVIFLAKDNERIVAGPVSTAAVAMRGEGNALDADPADGWTLRLGQHDYELYTERTELGGHERIRVLLRKGETEQVLATGRDSSLCANLIWAGDLDRDGALDLLLDMSSGENASIPTLFLSSSARPGQLLRAVAEMVITGC